MNPRETRRSPVYRQLEAYHESWQRDHATAMICRDWEDAIAVGINIFDMIQQREQFWREQVFRGIVLFDPEDDLDYRERFAIWLETTEPILADTLPAWEQEFGAVEGADRLRDRALQAKMIVQDWQPPRLSVAIGLREMTLSPEAAAELSGLLEQAKTLPSEMLGPRLPELTLAEFLRRKRQPLS